MARLGMVPRIVGLIFLILAMAIGGLFWFDFLGVINASRLLSPVLGLFNAAPVTIDPDDPLLLDSIRVRRQEEALELKYQDLVTRNDELNKNENTFSQRASELDEREKAHDLRENSFKERTQQYDDRYANLVQNARYLNSMRPDEAVKILAAYDDQLMIDTLRVAQEIADQAGAVSLVSVWLSRMDANRASEIQRKMTLKPPRE